jgi:hypothetical protein
MAYVASPIQYYRVNANNDIIASSSRGNSGTPTEEITEPLASTGTFNTYAASPTPTITGNLTSFDDFDEGQYLYYIDTNGNYKLVGQIATIGGPTTLTLTAEATNTPTASSVLAAAYALITNNESIYVRIPGETAGTNLWYMPRFSSWRQGNNTNNTTYAQLQQMSQPGSPLVNSNPTPVNVPFTFVTTNNFAQVDTINGVPVYFGTENDFPEFLWIKVTPLIGTSTSLLSKTLYRFTINESQPDLIVGLNTTKTILSGAGYAFPAAGAAQQQGGTQ